MLRIALPNKGRLNGETLELLSDAGLDVRTAGDRALVATVGDAFEAIFVRSADIPEFVADGAADGGVTGFDLVTESRRELTELLDLGYGRCRIVVAAREDSEFTSLEDFAGAPRVATVFPRLAESFFAKHGHAVTIVPVSGATEIAPHLGIADIIVDLTSTGTTLRTNGLREIATVLESSARLFASPAALGDSAKRGGLDELTAVLASVIRARGQRYLMANIPRSALDRVRSVLPGLNGPTIVDILNGGTMVAVHAVVAAAAVYRTIAELKSIGAEGILVTRIERLTP